jgi:hypothetical protein
VLGDVDDRLLSLLNERSAGNCYWLQALLEHQDAVCRRSDSCVLLGSTRVRSGRLHTARAAPAVGHQPARARLRHRSRGVSTPSSGSATSPPRSSRRTGPMSRVRRAAALAEVIGPPRGRRTCPVRPRTYRPLITRGLQRVPTQP